MERFELVDAAVREHDRVWRSFKQRAKVLAARPILAFWAEAVTLFASCRGVIVARPALAASPREAEPCTDRVQHAWWRLNRANDARPFDDSCQVRMRFKMVVCQHYYLPILPSKRSSSSLAQCVFATSSRLFVLEENLATTCMLSPILALLGSAPSGSP